MATKYWIKIYHEVLDDPKMGRLPDNLWRRFFECCLLAGEANRDDGDPQNGRLPSTEDMAWRFRVDEEKLRQELNDMARRGLIEYRADNPLDGYWFVTSFDKRQSKMPKAEYMRRLRQERSGMLPSSDQRSYQYVTNGHADIDIDIDTDIDEKKNHTYIHSEPEPIQKLITALSSVSKTPYWPKTENDYNAAAYVLFGYDVAPEKVVSFGDWWSENGFYDGKPALKSIMDNWSDYTAGYRPKAPKQAIPVEYLDIIKR